MFRMNQIGLTVGLILLTEAVDGTEGGGGGGFNPTEIKQGVGLFQTPAEMRATAEQQQANEDETGSLGGDVDTNDETVGTDAAKPSPIAEESLDASGKDVDATAPEHTGFVYGGVEVEVTNKPEMVTAFEEKGIDIDKVNKELFSEAGLTDATKSVLDEAFGKAAVDMYLEGWTGKNEAMIASANANVEAQNQATTKILTDIAGDKSDDVFKWANDNLSAEEYKGYADIINGDNPLAMELAFKTLTDKSGLVTSLTPPVVKPSARSTAMSADTSAPASSTVQGLSAKAYQDLFTPDKETGKTPYWDNPAKYDAEREVGRQNGL